MDEGVATYIQRGKFLVDGWLRTEAALTVANVAAEQRRRGVAGGTAEIGIHHGKLFILLYLLSRPPEKAVAIDLFEDQHLNVDSSGEGDLARFRANLERHADSRRLVVHKGDSTRLTGDALRQLADGPLRLISIDGGHTEEITASDLGVAAKRYRPKGLALLAMRGLLDAKCQFLVEVMNVWIRDLTQQSMQLGRHPIMVVADPGADIA